VTDLRVRVVIEADDERFEIILSKEIPAQRNADGRLAIFRLDSLWDRARDDAQAWVNARTGVIHRG